MSEIKHTQGPLFVTVSEKFPFNIITTDSNGKELFVKRLPHVSTQDKSVLEAIECRNSYIGDRQKYSNMNKKAIANEVLRAAAPELLESNRELAEFVREVCSVLHIVLPEKLLERSDKAIDKAEGRV